MGDLWEAVENRVSALSQLRVRRVLGRWCLWYFGFTKQETASCDPDTPALAAAQWPEGLETTQCDGQGQVTDRTAMAVLLRGVTDVPEALPVSASEGRGCTAVCAPVPPSPPHSPPPGLGHPHSAAEVPTRTRALEAFPGS